MGLMKWFFHLFCLYLLNFHSQVTASSAKLCLLDQCTTLLKFKSTFSIDKSASAVCDFYHGITSYPKTESWNKSNHCCLWDGVMCDKLTSNVIGLDVSCSCLRGIIHSNSALFCLPHLQKLNLAYNDFGTSPISSKFGSFTSLTHLNLSNSSFSGQIPSEISYLSKLISIDFSYNCHQLQLERTAWRRLVENLTELRELSFDEVNMGSIEPRSLINLSSSLTSLSVSNCNLQGEIPASVFRLKNLLELRLANNENLRGCLPESNWSISLRFLDTSSTKLSGKLPDAIGNLKNLKELHLGRCNFTGSIPASLANLTEVMFLDLSSNNLTGKIPSSFSNLEHLTNLDLSRNNLKGQIPDVFSNLRKLVNLSLAYNNFQGHLPASAFNMLEISLIDFSGNQLKGSIPSHASGLSHLTKLTLADNLLNGTVPSWVFTLPFLQFLDLSFNHLTGQLVEFYSKSLRCINLRNNNFYGSVPGSVFEFVNLTDLVLSANNFSGNLDFNMFSKLQNLQWLNLSYNSFVLSNNSNVTYTLPQLRKLSLSSCNLSEFPRFLGEGEHLLRLELSNNQIQGEIPIWIMNMGENSLYHLSLSNNSLTAIERIRWKNLIYLDLSANLLQGPLPVPPPSIAVYSVSHNNFSGQIPLSFCNMSSLMILDLSSNKLNGIIPQCFGNFSHKLSVLNLRLNRFHGTIPDTCGENNVLRNINFNSNDLVGPLPQSLIKCENLEILDVGNNKINGSFPYWLGTLRNLQVLVLQSNRFRGPIHNPRTISSFPKLRIIDLSHNEFTGLLPTRYFDSFKALMKGDENQVNLKYMGEEYYQDSVIVTMKGLKIELVKIITLFTAIDFSNNRFRGEIVGNIGNLKFLRGLNLSHNNFSGHLSPSLGNLTNLEWLDLSHNRLAGQIPTELVDMKFLEILNLSQNQLTGAVPRGNQFSTFPNDSYDGNLGLCGFPLSKTSDDDMTSEPPQSMYQDKDDSASIYDFGWKVVLVGYVCGIFFGMGIGYIVFRTGKPEWLAMMLDGRRRRKLRENMDSH